MTRNPGELRLETSHQDHLRHMKAARPGKILRWPDDEGFSVRCGACQEVASFRDSQRDTTPGCEGIELMMHDWTYHAAYGWCCPPCCVFLASVQPAKG